MGDEKADRRKLSGNRVVARCEVVVKKADPFAPWDPVKRGHVVMNVRGGCLYIGEYFDEDNIEKLFPYEGEGLFTQLTLRADNRPDVVLEDLKVGFLRLRREAQREGVVFRFLNITEAQLDTLIGVQQSFPPIGNSEESSVPFDEVISLDRSDTLTLQD